MRPESREARQCAAKISGSDYDGIDPLVPIKVRLDGGDQWCDGVAAFRLAGDPRDGQIFPDLYRFKVEFHRYQRSRNVFVPVFKGLFGYQEV